MRNYKKLISRYLVPVLMIIIAANNCYAQVPDESKPASSNVRGAEYPRITTDSRVIFQLKAPDAQKVQIQLDKLYDLKRDDKGIWTVTTDPQSLGFHYYSLVIDGVYLADPASETYYGMGRMASGIEISKTGIDFYDVKDVPHGDIRSKRYFSNTTGTWRQLFIYTPPGYDMNTNEKYPVLYIQHGGGEDQRGWATQGKTDLILDNLIAEGKAKPMLIVMADGNFPGGFSDEGREKFRNEMLNNVIPFVEKSFRVLPGSENRALSGLSMGGIETLHTGLLNTDKFSYLCVLSSGWFTNQPASIEKYRSYIEKNSSNMNKNLKLLFVAIGGQEDIAYKNCQSMLKMFDTYGLKYTYHEYPGGHTWPVWRENLYVMAPLLFK